MFSPFIFISTFLSGIRISNVLCPFFGVRQRMPPLRSVSLCSSDLSRLIFYSCRSRFKTHEFAAALRLSIFPHSSRSTCYGLDSIFCSNAIPHSLRGSHRLPTSRIRYEIHRFVLSTFAYKIRSSFIFGLDAPNSDE